MLAVRIAGCVLGELKVALGAREAEMTQALAERRVRLRKYLATLGERGRERLAHADLLRALSRKHESNHDSFTVIAATPRSSRATRPSLENRSASRIAFRTALADERPWPTTTTPLTPSSGAPPYSE